MADTVSLLHDVLARLDALEHTNAQLQQDNVILKQQNAALLQDRLRPSMAGASVEDMPASSLERMSRRWVLRRGMQAAAASVTASVLLQHETQQADASHGPDMITANQVHAHVLNSSSENGGQAISGYTHSAFYPAISGYNSGDQAGVQGSSADGNGVLGTSSNIASSGVYGTNDAAGFGVAGDTTSTVSTGSAWDQRAGVLGRNNGSGPGVIGLSSSTSGDGVIGEGKVGVRGKSAAAAGSAMLAEGSGSAIGIMATSQSGYGAVLIGGRAQLRLVPKGLAGKPTAGSHQVGELVLDKVGTLFICTVAGTPGTWRKVSTTAV